MITAIRRIRFGIVNPKIIHNKNQIKHDPRLSFYPVVGFKETKTGAMMLNKPDNNNNVTQQCADELYRFLSSYHHDHTVENVWIQNKGSSFSGGADYEELLKNTNYLDKLMRLSIMIGQFNKPIFAKVHGSVRGIAAYILTMFSTPIGTDKSSLRLDQTAKGFIPIFGGSHKLSRLPCNIGIYLALTGDKLDSHQMARLGFLKGYIKDDAFTNKSVRKHLSDANLFMKNIYTPSAFSPSQIKRENLMLFKMNYFYDLISQTQRQLFKSSENFYSKFALNQYRIAQTQYYNTIKPYNSFSAKNIDVHNYYEMRHDRPFKYLKQKGIIEEARTEDNLVSRLPIMKLIKVFNKDTIEGVFEELKKDDSQWARKTQQMIRKKDPLAVNLTFRLIKDAKKLSWVEALENQYKVARRLLNISKIDHVDVSEGGSVKILTNEYSKLKAQEISKQVLDNFFNPYKDESQIFDHDTPNHSLLPTSEFWKKVPDAARNYLNRTFFEDIHSKFGEVEVKRFLHMNKIDYRDRSYNISTLREYLYKQMDYQKLIDLEKQRIRGIFQHELFYSNLIKQRMEYAQKKLENSSQFNKLIAQQIKQYFDKKFRQRYDELKQTAKIAGKQSRMNILRKYVNTLIDNIVKNGNKIENQNRANNHRHRGIVRFDNKGSDIFTAETQHQKTVAQLNTLKKAYKNRDINQLEKINDTNFKPQYMLFKNQFTQWEHDLIKKDAALRLNYNKTILPRQMAAKYKYLIGKAAETSQQVAGFLGWQNHDIQAIITNAPKNEQTFKSFAQNVMRKTQQVQARIEQLNKKFAAFEHVKNKQMKKLLQEKPQQNINHLFFDSKMIPRPFRDVHLQLFNQVLSFFTKKYEINGQISSGEEGKQKKESIINEWGVRGLNTNFTKLMKNDVEYVFSYLIVMHLKQILAQLQAYQSEQMEEIIAVAQEVFGISFAGYNKNQFNNMIMKYLYSALDLHEDSKHKIIFPQTKMIDFINTLKIETQIDVEQNLSFQTLMLLIAKDRKMIRDYQQGRVPLLGYDPQINLNVLATEHEKYQASLPIMEQINNNFDQEEQNEEVLETQSIQNLQKLSTTLQFHKQQKQKLILGWKGYLMRFQAIMQKVAGNTMFLPKDLYQCKNKKTYEFMKELLKIEQTHQQWFKAKIASAVSNLLEFRFQKQKRMSQGQLQLFDQQYAELFTSELMRLVIKYETYTEQNIAKILIGEQKVDDGTNENIHSRYLDLKNQIKNPRALKMLNNLIMTSNVIKDRIEELYQSEKEKSQDVSSQQERRDLDYQRRRPLNPRTLQRLANESIRYADSGSYVNEKNIKLTRSAIVGKPDDKSSRFLSQLKNIQDLLQTSDLKSELQDRLKRVQVLQA